MVFEVIREDGSAHTITEADFKSIHLQDSWEMHLIIGPKEDKISRYRKAISAIRHICVDVYSEFGNNSEYMESESGKKSEEVFPEFGCEEYANPILDQEIEEDHAIPHDEPEPRSKRCKHSITTVDCQPSGPADGMLVFVSGNLQLAGNNTLLSSVRYARLAPPPTKNGVGLGARRPT
ncbi:Nuclear transport factor 2 [Cynara cardunculus var. scolymus]|uniref:Nuclear transport factor 2 n=1 Tax=Cynara cardunculus var. scolymus TaxID=59895 RepID=A0A124SE31_CYNCS|nr:Nuclear transport factor 2 [Cynara cardunculus var. scolymus]